MLNRIVVLFFLGAPLAIASDTTATLDVAPQSALTYHVVHKFHEMTGVSHQIQGRARLLTDGTLQAMVRVPVSSFDSGNGNRDEHMMETVEANKYPLVEFKGTANGVAMAGPFPAHREVKLNGELTFHGVKRPVEVPLMVTFADAKHAAAKGKFALSLTAFNVDRPSLLFVPIDDTMDMTVNLAVGVAQ